jgi:hypothetical protein
MSLHSNLNSVLLEGVVSGSPNVVKEEGNVRCSFVVSSFHALQEGKHVRRQETRVWVMIRDTKKAKTAALKACDGCGVRIVGWLAIDVDEEDNVPHIVAEHIEYRPELNGKEK